MNARLRNLFLGTNLLLCIATAGCQVGGTSFAGLLGDRPFDPNGTAFTYVDANDDNLDPYDLQRAVVFMSWLIFDPNGDLNDYEGAQLAELRHEYRLRDSMALVFNDQDALLEDETYVFETESGNVKRTDGMEARLYVAPERLTGASTYSDFRSFGSLRRFEVTLDTVDFLANQGQLSGAVTIDIDRAPSDPQSARTGRIEGRFTAPLVNERIAEHNLAVLQTENALGLPLAGEAQP